MAKTQLIELQHDQLTLGASQIAAAAGMDPWKTTLELYLDKLHGRQPSSSPYLEWGLLNEPHILQVYARKRGVQVLGMDMDEEPCLFRPEGRPLWSSLAPFKRRVGDGVTSLITETCVHPNSPVLTCHPDGFEVDSGAPTTIVQAKNMSAWADIPDEVLPTNYQMQAHHELLVVNAMLGKTLGHRTPIFVGGSQLLVFDTVPDTAIAESIWDVAHSFIQRVQEGRAPDATRDDDGAADLARMYPGERDRGLLIQGGSEMEKLVVRMRAVKDDLAELGAEKKAIGVDIRNELGDHTSANTLDKTDRVTWSVQRQKVTVDWEEMAAEIAAEGDMHPRRWDELKLKHTSLSKPFRTFKTTHK